MCTKTEFHVAHLGAGTSSTNILPPALLDPETCPPSQCASSGGACSNRRLARYTVPQSKCRLPSASGYAPRCKTISHSALAIPLRFASPPRPLRPRSSCSPHAPPARTTVPLHLAIRALRAPGSVKWHANAAYRHKKIPKYIGKPSDATAKSPAVGIPSPAESSSAHRADAPVPIFPRHPAGFLSSAAPIAARRPATPVTFPLARPLAHPPT